MEIWRFGIIPELPWRRKALRIRIWTRNIMSFVQLLWTPPDGALRQTPLQRVVPLHILPVVRFSELPLDGLCLLPSACCKDVVDGVVFYVGRIAVGMLVGLVERRIVVVVVVLGMGKVRHRFRIEVGVDLGLDLSESVSGTLVDARLSDEARAVETLRFVDHVCVYAVAIKRMNMYLLLFGY